MLTQFQHPIHGPIKLGKKPARRDPRTLKFAKYAKALPPPPLNSGYVDLVNNYPMYGNDSIGDCVEAAMAHEEQRWTIYAGKPWTPGQADVVKAYSAITGYDPNDPTTDNGTDPLVALNWWRKHGLAGTHKIVAFAAVDPANRKEVQQALTIFGGVFTGLQLPIAAQSPVAGLNGCPCWGLSRSFTDPSGVPGSWGGHMVDLAGYGVDARNNSGAMVITWGQRYDVTWGFLAAYSDEMWAIVTQDWIEKNGKSPSGFDIKTLLDDLVQIAS